MPYVPDVHADQFLTNISQLVTNEGYVGNAVLPPRPVEKRSDLYEILGNEHFKVTNTLRRPGSRAAEVNYTLSKGFYNAEEYAMASLVPAQLQKTADNPPIDPEVERTMQLTEQMMLDRENRQMALVADPTQVTNNTSLSGTSQWSDYTNSTPLTNIKAARTTVRAAIHREATDATFSFDVALTLADHPSFKDLIKYTHDDVLSVGGLPPSVRGLKVNVSKADKDTTGYGSATPSYSPVFSKSSLIHYTNPNFGLRSITFGVTFEVPDPITGARGVSIRKWLDDARKGVWVEGADTYVAKLIAPTAAYLYLTAIA